MPEPLVTYLNDHLAGAQIALQLLEQMEKQHDDQHYREFATAMLPEIRSDDGTLRKIIEDSLNSEPSHVKAAIGWLTEKASRLKLGHTRSPGMEMFEALEMLSLGILGKLSLALRVVSIRDAGFTDLISTP